MKGRVAFQYFGYLSLVDTRSIVTAPGYFNSIRESLRINDVIKILDLTSAFAITYEVRIVVLGLYGDIEVEETKVVVDEATLDHDLLSGLNLAGTGITYGHVTDLEQWFYGQKRFVLPMASPGLFDDDLDTGVWVEKAADEDIIRFDLAGAEEERIEHDKHYFSSGSLWYRGAERWLTHLTANPSNIAFGPLTFNLTCTGEGNLVLGYNCMGAITSGTNNLAFGRNVLLALTTGNANIALGTSCLQKIVTGGSNMAIGQGAMEDTGIAAANNVAIGYTALRKVTSRFNVAIGCEAAIALAGGNRTTAIGGMSCRAVTTGSGNTGVGYNSLRIVTGGHNTAVGNEAGAGIISGTNNVFVGSQAGQTSTNNISNALALGYNVQVTASNTGRIGNGISIGIDCQPNAKFEVKGTSRLGDQTNYSEFEANGFFVARGSASSFNEVNAGLTTGKIPSSNYPAWSAMIGNIYEYQFAIGDYLDLSPLELLHDWKEGTAIELHVHWATGGLNDATVRGVKWEIEYSWANKLGQGGTMVFATSGPSSAETSIAAAEPALTHKYTSVVSFTPTGGKIGMYLLMRLKRIASVTNIAPAANPFGLAVGVHYEQDTLGSRTQVGK